MNFNLISESSPVVRKVHRCVWCGEDINKGEKYHARTYTFEGLQNDKAHLDCKQAMNSINWHEYDNGFDPHQFQRGKTISKWGDGMILNKETT